MTPAYLHQELMQACEHGSVEDVQESLNQEADPNFNIKSPTNALNAAIQRDNHPIIKLLLDHGAIVKEFVLQKAIEKNKNYLQLLIPDFSKCKDEMLLMGALQAAINIGDVDLASRAILQGAKPESLYLFAIREINSTEVLQLLIEVGFDIHAGENMILSEWMGVYEVGKLEERGVVKYNLLTFISDYYLNNPDLMPKFDSLRLSDKRRLFTLGLGNNNFTMMKFALAIGADKSEALNHAIRQYNAYKQGSISSVHSTLFKDNKNGKVDYEIIEYILNLNIEFNKITISNAVFFKYTDVLNALSHMHDLEYGYEMAYKYEDKVLCEYFIERGVSKEAQNFAKMRISTISGDIKELRKAVNDGANLEALDREIIVEVINNNQIEILKYLHGSDLLLDTSLNRSLNKAMNQYKAYETISYLIELGFDITKVKKIPVEYKRNYPLIADMWKKRFSNIFDYTIYLAKEIYPNVEGKEQEEVLKRVAQLSTLPYVIKRSQGKTT
ncbi:MAG: ankyrin repeat domain-containing protein [Campylobacterota bacterium]|nr:ankyrin repeat domain-containing protein [Campylobacterota bacterium]